MRGDLRHVQPIFKKVLDCFDSRAEFGRQIGANSRQLVDAWLRHGYIPASWAVAAQQATGGKVSAIELLNEANRMRMTTAARRRVLREMKAKSEREGAAG